MAGTTSVGPPPETMALTVADAPGAPGSQRWTYEARSAAGNGVVEELTLGRGAEGVRMSGTTSS